MQICAVQSLREQLGIVSDAPATPEASGTPEGYDAALRRKRLERQQRIAEPDKT